MVAAGWCKFKSEDILCFCVCLNHHLTFINPLDCKFQVIVKKASKHQILDMTLTAGDQFDISSVDESRLVGGLASKGDLLRLEEGHLAADSVDFKRLTVADIGLDAQLLWLWCQRLPHRSLVVAPAPGHRIGGGWGGSSRNREQSQNSWSECESEINLCVLSAL